MKLCFVTILEPVNLRETFRDALIWESTQKKTDDLKMTKLRPVSQKLQVVQNFVGTMGAFHGNFLLPVGSNEDVS